MGYVCYTVTMNEFKYQLTQLIFVILLGLGAYWALTHLDGGVSYTRENIVTEQEVSQAQPDAAANSVGNETPTNTIEPESNSEVEINTITPEETPVVSSDSNTELAAELERLANARVNLDSGDNGAQVATVQKFLDVYFTDRNVTIDSDFGPTTKGLVRDFQQAELNGGDGRIGPNTLKAMVEYLNAQ